MRERSLLGRNESEKKNGRFACRVAFVFYCLLWLSVRFFLTILYPVSVFLQYFIHLSYNFACIPKIKKEKYERSWKNKKAKCESSKQVNDGRFYLPRPFSFIYPFFYSYVYFLFLFSLFFEGDFDVPT